MAVSGDMTAVEHNIAAARRVCEAWNVMELEEFRSLFDPQVDYRNIPIDGDRHTGPDAVHQVLASFREKWDASLRVDKDANKDFYGATIATDEMVRGIAKTTPAGSQWIATLTRLVPPDATR